MQWSEDKNMKMICEVIAEGVFQHKKKKVVSEGMHDRMLSLPSMLLKFLWYQTEQPTEYHIFIVYTSPFC